MLKWIIHFNCIKSDPDFPEFWILPSGKILYKHLELKIFHFFLYYIKLSLVMSFHENIAWCKIFFFATNPFFSAILDFGDYATIHLTCHQILILVYLKTQQDRQAKRLFLCNITFSYRLLCYSSSSQCPKLLVTIFRNLVKSRNRVRFD